MKNILLIEPDRVLAGTYTRTLEGAGYSVRHVVGAEQAIRLADTAKPDAVIISLEMARHNGVEFLYEFRSYSEWRHIPALVLTSTPHTDLLDATILREQLGVEAVLVRSQTHADDLLRTLRLIATRKA